jgi:autotransporter adhesin
VIGAFSSASGNESSVLGYNTSASGPKSLALGWNTDAIGADSIGVGSNASATGNNSIAIGNVAFSAAHQSIAIGNGADVFTSGGIAIGISTFVNGNASIALGNYSEVSGTRATGLGETTRVSGSLSVGIGWEANAEGNNSIAFGARSYAPNPNTLILGPIPGVPSLPGINNGGDYLDIGNGTNKPLASLHIERDSGSAGILVRNSASPDALDKVMFQLSNPDDSIVRFVMDAGGELWTFDNNPKMNPSEGINAGEFRISKVGTGIAEFTVNGFGDGMFAGVSIATEHINTSSRESKTDFAPVSVASILDKVDSLPISQWRYKSDARGKVHVGPVAEDFQEIFGLGDGKTISTVDASGVALASIQALNEKLEKQNAALKSEVKELRSLVMQLLPQTAQN